MANATSLADSAAQHETNSLESRCFEVINGCRVDLKPLPALRAEIACALATELSLFCRERKLGRCVLGCLFPTLPDASRQRRPTVAFVSYERWPKDRPLPQSDPWPVVPDLAVEVVSSGDLVEYIEEKIDEYLRSRVTMVWVVRPKMRQIYVYDSPTCVQIVTVEGALDGGTVVPGFRRKVADLFEPAK